MLLLAADTSGKHGSVALARAEPGNLRVIEAIPLAGGTFSAQLVPQIAALLAKHGFSKQDIDGFAVASGPGSFTGLRVGLAAIKGLAEVLGKPLAAVSLLQLVAASSNQPGRVVALLDAGRGEVYCGEYERSEPATKVLGECLLRLEEVRSQPAVAAGALVVTPDENVAQTLQTAGGKVRVVARPSAADVARQGLVQILRGETVSPEELEANYIRRSDAEIFSNRVHWKLP